MEHIFEEHIGCQLDSCFICDGGLKHCTVCGGAESSLPTECPEKVMNEDQERAVIDKRVDYKGGKWVILKNGWFEKKMLIPVSKSIQLKGDALLCPRCGGINLTQKSVKSFFRDKEAGPGTVSIFNRGGVLTSRFEPKECAGDDCINIEFLCEQCGEEDTHILEILYDQNKTSVSWLGFI